jgi:hypothetical protein
MIDRSLWHANVSDGCMPMTPNVNRCPCFFMTATELS